MLEVAVELLDLLREVFCLCPSYRLFGPPVRHELAHLFIRDNIPVLGRRLVLVAGVAARELRTTYD